MSRKRKERWAPEYFQKINKRETKEIDKELAKVKKRKGRDIEGKKEER